MESFQKNPKENLNIFSKSKSVPFYKSLKVARFFDSSRQCFIYMSYPSKLRGDNASHDISSVCKP